jgi:hypothetical protein
MNAIAQAAHSMKGKDDKRLAKTATAMVQKARTRDSLHKPCRNWRNGSMASIGS